MATIEPNTFHQDFAIAEVFGMDAVKDTFNRAFNEWKTNYKMLTALVIVMNERCWGWYQRNNALSKLYSDYYYQAREYALDNLKDDEFDYYFELTD